jgi:hypothetical protein
MKMKFIRNYIEDILIVSGLALVIYATFLLSKIGGIYCAGAALFGLGVWFAKHPPMDGRENK